jgi:hypothetical protein
VFRASNLIALAIIRVDHKTTRHKPIPAFAVGVVQGHVHADHLQLFKFAHQENAPTGDDIAANVNAAVKAELDSSPDAATPDAPKPDGSSWLYRRRNRRRTLPQHTQILQAERHLQWPAWFRPYHNVKTRLHPCQTAP